MQGAPPESLGREEKNRIKVVTKISEHDFHTWGSLWACQTQPPQTSGQNPYKEFLQSPGEEPAPQWDPQTTFKGATKAQKWKCMLILEQQ